MKKLIILLFLLVPLAVSAEMRCKLDYTGATVCTITNSGTNSSGGWNPPQVIRGTTDYTGATVWTDSQGKSTRCTKDFTGAVVCR